MRELVDILRAQAAEIAAEDHNGWGNTMLFAAEEIERLREDCAEAYQVCGAALLCPDEVNWTDDDVVRVLDNLSAAANGDQRPHDDLLPWPKP